MRRKLQVAGVCAASVMLLSAAAANKKPALTTAYVDHLIRAEWNKAKITPAPPADDARFLRRVYLDIAGVIPPADIAAAFLNDKSPDKRAKAVDRLLQSPQYVEHWAGYWDEVLMGHGRLPGNYVDRVEWRKWLREQFARNTPYDKFALELIAATGQNSTGGSYAKVAGLMTPADKGEEAGPADGARVNGAVNWFLKFVQAPADLSGAVSKTFLGVQIQCAQCHDHKTEKWKQEDFKRFTACFARTRPVPVQMGQVKGMRRVEVRDIEPPLFRRAQTPRGMNEYAASTPAALDGTDFAASPSRRKALAEWITSKQNPYFSRAIVNRMWGHFLGRGFVEPINDFRDTNPANMPHLLSLLAEDFEEHNFDLKYLIKQICATQVYQLSSAAARNAGSDNSYWARYRLKPMSPPQLMESLVQAANLGPVLEKVAGGNVEQIKQRALSGLTFLFDVDEEQEQKEFEGTIPQALLLLNGGITNSGATPIPGTALAEVLSQSGDDAQKIESLYLRTVSRKPAPAELKKWIDFIYAPRKVTSAAESAEPQRPLTPRERRKLMQDLQRKNARRGGGQDPFARIGGRVATTDPRHQAYEDLFWALLNSSEFIFNH